MRRIKNGEELAANAEFARVDITGLNSALVQDIGGLVARKAIPRGKAITVDMTEQLPEKVKGDTIRLIYKSDDINIEIAAIAEGNAIAGKTFPVKNPQSGKVFMALYQGNGTAVKSFRLSG